MQLKDVRREHRGKKYRFEYNSREDFVRNAVLIRVDGNDRVLSMRLNSAQYGIALWEKERGLVECNTWENEDQIAAISGVAQHFPAALAGAARDEAFADKILKDCLDAGDDEYLMDRIRIFCLEKRAAEFRLEKFGINTVPVRKSSPVPVTTLPAFRESGAAFESPPAFSLPSNLYAAPRHTVVDQPVRVRPAYVEPEPEVEDDYVESYEDRRRRAILLAKLGLLGAGLGMALFWFFILRLFFS